jgi:chemotaxis protein MotB
VARADPTPPAPIIVKKIIVEGHGGHHGGAWKVAYADFVTAMMAFFLLMWLLGATTEKQRRALADYFTPTLVEMRQNSAGSNGMFGGESITSRDNYPERAGQTGTRSITIPRDATGTADTGGRDAQHREGRQRDQQRFRETQRRIEERLARNAQLRRLRRNLRFTQTREGLRIDLVDEADFAMFTLGTERLLPEARVLVGEIASVIAEHPNQLIVRGHTDALPYAANRTMSNWRLSAGRADATRQALVASGVGRGRFERIEGVADREPFNARDRNDPRNRRMSVTLAWSRSGGE